MKLSGIFTLLVACLLIVSGTGAQTPPNVVVIFVDDMAYADLACFGATDIETPNLDKLAAGGARLTHFYTAQPVCSAARAALLTGCYSNRVGIHQALMPGSKVGLNPEEITIAEMLKTRGYATAMFGKWHLGDDPECMPNRQGFDEYWGLPYSNDMWPRHPQQGTVFQFPPLPVYHNQKKIAYLEDQSQLTTEITRRGVKFIKQHRKHPFFMYIAHPMPHVPLHVSSKFKGRSKHGLYGDVVMELDWSVGQIVKTLEQYHLLENTLLIFTSDNGPWVVYGNHAGNAGPFREGKGTVWEGGVREPCIIHFPGLVPAGAVINTPAMTIDFLPTIAAATRTELPKQKLDGVNLMPLLSGQSSRPPHEALFFYYNVNELQAIRYDRWKLYFPHTYRTLLGGFAGMDGLPGEYRHITMTAVELYDLEADPSETKDLAKEHPELVQKMTQMADAMRAELGDALTKQNGTETRAPWRKEK